MMNFNNFKNNFGKVIQIVNFVKRCKLVFKKKKKKKLIFKDGEGSKYS